MIQFWVPGKALPAGSKRSFQHKVTGKIVVTDANPKSKGWKEQVRVVARTHMGGSPPLTGPVAVDFVFNVLRPKSHLRSDGVNLSMEGQRKPWPTSKPDLLKLARGVEDALTGIVYEDDAQIVFETMRKQWSQIEGVQVRVQEMTSSDPQW